MPVLNQPTSMVLGTTSVSRAYVGSSRVYPQDININLNFISFSDTIGNMDADPVDNITIDLSNHNTTDYLIVVLSMIWVSGPAALEYVRLDGVDAMSISDHLVGDGRFTNIPYAVFPPGDYGSNPSLEVRAEANYRNFGWAVFGKAGLPTVREVTSDWGTDTNVTIDGIVEPGSAVIAAALNTDVAQSSWDPDTNLTENDLRFDIRSNEWFNLISQNNIQTANVLAEINYSTAKSPVGRLLEIT